MMPMMSTAVVQTETSPSPPTTSSNNTPQANSVNVINDDDLLHDINPTQLQDYKQMLHQLGEYPDKILINTLTMIAEDYSKAYPKSSRDIYNAIKEMLLSHTMKPSCKLPLVYVIDSILKNARGLFIEIMAEDFSNVDYKKEGDDNDNWMKDVYEFLGNDEQSKVKLRKTWNTWNKWEQTEIFPHDIWSKIGQCFIDDDLKVENAKKIADAKARAVGIQRQADGTLQLSNKLRKHMQTVLDEIQMNEVNELDKISLERLADINPDLLVQIKNAADEMIQNEEQNQQNGGAGEGGIDSTSSSIGVGSLSTTGNGSNITSSTSPIFQDLRSPALIKQCEEWEKLNLNHLDNANEVIKRLTNHVREGTNATISDPNFTNEKQNQIINLYVSASATGSHLTSLLEQLKKQDLNRGMMKFKAGSIKDLTGNLFLQGPKVIDKVKFTNEGLKEKNDSAISRLYEGGLAFVCPADGRRFATQIELSKHYDALFKKNQLEKSMEMTDERGWYESDLVWSGILSKSNDWVVGGIDNSMVMDNAEQQQSLVGVGATSIIDDPKLSTVTADDSRSKCIICGVNFNMKFNEEEGDWKYENCKEIIVMNDDVAEKESENMLAHATCLKGLGSPRFLTRDQVLNIY